MAIVAEAMRFFTVLLLLRVSSEVPVSTYSVLIKGCSCM